jgi:hypothetical protein
MYHSMFRRRERVRKVAEGATVNGTYQLPPGEALAAFRADLIAILDATRKGKT